MLQLIHDSTDDRVSMYNLLLNGQKVGECQIRHKASHGDQMPEGSETQVYYEISPLNRRRGFGTQLLRLALKEARRKGMTEVLIGADVSNVASVRVIEKNGGQLVEVFLRLDSGEPVNLYRVTL